MPRFGKNVLSQYLRTKCDKQLRLSLYTPSELKSMGWPEPLTARPAVQILRDVGIEWEQAKLGDLETAFPGHIDALKQNGKFNAVALLTVLRSNPPSPTFVLQPSFGHVLLRQQFLQSIGTPTPLANECPPFGEFRPDLILVQTKRDDEIEILPNGTVSQVDSSDTRKALVICDIKHAGEANSSYSSEVCLYAILLANWLRLENLDQQFLVTTRVSLWTRAKEISSLSQLMSRSPGASLSERLEAFFEDLDPIDFTIFYLTIDHFFKVDLPRVQSVTCFQDLDWHVDSRCSACDFLGYRGWLNSTDRAKLDENRNHYCVTCAEDTAHLSRIATVSRGGRRTLQQLGVQDVRQVAGLTSNSQVFDEHNSLKADRNHLPSRAEALSTGDFSIAQNTSSVDMPKWADLEIFIAINFDPGSGLLTSIGSEARFHQFTNFGQTSQVNRVWQCEVQTLLSPTLSEERSVVVSFLSRLAEVFSFAYSTDPNQGGPQAARTRTQLYFWDRRQFEELANAVGRHLSVIVNPNNDRMLRGLVWLFPPEETLENDELVLANPVTFVKSAIQRDLRLPVAHSLTLFNAHEAYHDPQFRPSVPGSFYRDPYSDMIPRERIYEIWSNEPLVKLGLSQKTRSQCITTYGETVRQQVTSLRSIVWKFREDMGQRLRYSANALNIGIPFNFQQMSEDGRLWYGWARLEEACRKIELKHIWAEEPEQLEAKYEILRFEALLSQSGNDYVFRVRQSSQDCKFSDSDGFLALQDEALAGFLNLRLRDVAPQSQFQPSELNRSLASIFQATLISYDRTNLVAQVRLTDFGNSPSLRQYLIDNGQVNLTVSVSLVSGIGPSMAERIRECVRAIGRPSISAAAQATYGALGHAPGSNLPRTDVTTMAAEVLWNASALSVESSTCGEDDVNYALTRLFATDWPINESQRLAIEHCMLKRLSIVWGPPGTGKTTTAAALLAARILIAIEKGDPLRILVTGPTYNAWEKLFGDAVDLLNRLNVTEVRAFRVYSANREASDLDSSTISVTDLVAKSSEPEFQTLAQLLTSPNQIVMVGAGAHQCYRIAQEAHRVPNFQAFDFAVVDESSQLDVPTSLFPLCLMADDSQIVFLGDHLQMPPISATQPPKDAEWLVGSIQTYLLTRHACPQQPLLVNYRSAGPFVEFGRRIGYPSGLTAHSANLSLHQLLTFNSAPRNWQGSVEWGPELAHIIDPQKKLVAITYPDGRSGQANSFEAALTCALVQQLFLSTSGSLDGELDHLHNLKDSDHGINLADDFWRFGIGIVTPHRAQRALIVRKLREMFPMHSAELIGSAVDTVERFQGGQRNTIIISFGVGDPDLIADEEAFLLQLERTNVAISRARTKCIMCISDDLIYHLPSEKETIATSKAVKAFVSEVCHNSQQISLSYDGTVRNASVRWS